MDHLWVIVMFYQKSKLMILIKLYKSIYMAHFIQRWMHLSLSERFMCVHCVYVCVLWQHVSPHHTPKWHKGKGMLSRLGKCVEAWNYLDPKIPAAYRFCMPVVHRETDCLSLVWGRLNVMRYYFIMVLSHQQLANSDWCPVIRQKKMQQQRVKFTVWYRHLIK